MATSSNRAVSTSTIRPDLDLILAAVKNRRRYTWSLLSEHAPVVEIVGTVLQLAFKDPRACDCFVGSDSKEVLEQALYAEHDVQWTVTTTVDTGRQVAP